MAIALEFIDFIVPIAKIREKYPGGWAQCIEDHSDLLGSCVWHDDHLLRNGAMNSIDIEVLVEHWERLGFQPLGARDGLQFWKDCCVVEAMMGGPTLPCDWLKISFDGRSAHLTGTKPGEVVHRK